MKQKMYKILRHWITGKKGKVLQYNRTYPADMFVGDTLKEYIEKGYVEEVTEKKKSKPAATKTEAGDDADSGSDAGDEKTPVFVTEEGKEVFTYKDAKKDEIIAELEKRGIDFDSSDNKEVLFHKLQ